MMYVIWDHERGGLRRVDDPDVALGEGESLIPCDGTDWRTKLLTLDELKAAKLAELADARWRAETSGTELGGMRIATDRESQAMITGAALQATIDPSYVCRWKTSGGFVDLDAQTILGAAMAIRSWVQGCFDREAELADAVAASSTKEEVAAIGWDAAPAPRKAAKKAK